MKLGFTCLMHDLVICPQVCLSLCLNMHVKWLMRMIVMQFGAMQTLVGACTQGFACVCNEMIMDI